MAGKLDILTTRLTPPSDAFSTVGARVLVVDDTDASREAMRDILDTLQFAVDTASSGFEALSKVNGRKYEIILTDLKMPNMSGMDLLRAIKDTDPLLPVVVVTAFPSISIATEAMRGGAADFLTKPFDMALMDHVLKRVLRERSLLLRNQQLQVEVNQKAVIEELNRRLNEKVEELTKLYLISELMNKAVGNEALLKEIVAVSSRITGAEKVSIMLYDRERRELIIRAAVGLSRKVMRQTRLSVGEAVAGRVAETKQPLRADRFGMIGDTPAFTQGRPYRFHSFLSAPILVGDELFAVLNLTDKPDGVEFTEKDQELICNLAHKASIKLENNALYEGIYTNLVDTLRALVTTIEARDPYTHRHSQRVTDYALALGNIIGLDEESLETLEFTGILHDVGKIGIQDKILHKPGKLTDEEMTHIKAHPVIGETIVKPLGLIDVERSIIRHHHERIDGRGYPDGLLKDEIPLLVRVLAVADCFDAMTSDRPYRRAMSQADALGNLRDEADTHFDADIVDAMDRALIEGIITLPAGQGALVAVAN